MQTKELASRYERALQEAEMNMEKSKTRLDVSSEELERVLLQKEGEPLNESVVHAKAPGVLGGKRVLGKAVAKGGLLLKGKNPGNVCVQILIGFMWRTDDRLDPTTGRRYSVTCFERIGHISESFH